MAKNKTENNRIVAWVFIIILTISISCYSIFIVHVKNDNILKLRAEVETCNNNNRESINNKESISIDIYETGKKNQLRANIYSYIKNRYTRIPKIVASSIADNIIIFSDKYDISPHLLVGMIEIESRFNPMAISKKGARGLMQVMAEWIPKLKIKKVNDLHDIDTGIEAGIKVFKIHLKEAKGNISRGLYLYVGKDINYADNVYSAVGRFAMYQPKNKNEDKK